MTHDNCLYDIAATGDVAFAAGYRTFGALFNGLTISATRAKRPVPAATPAAEAD